MMTKTQRKNYLIIVGIFMLCGMLIFGFIAVLYRVPLPNAFFYPLLGGSAAGRHTLRHNIVRALHQTQARRLADFKLCVLSRYHSHHRCLRNRTGHTLLCQQRADIGQDAELR